MLRRLSAGRRVTFWYAISMLLLAVLTIGFLFFMEDQIVVDDAKGILISLTDNAASDISFADGHVILDDNMVFSIEEARLAVFDSSGSMIAGLLPENFAITDPPADNAFREVRNKAGEYFIYDRQLENEDGVYCWLRGTAPADLKSISPVLYSLLNLFITILPILLIISLIGSWRVTKRAFRPLSRIVDTVQHIQEGKDLSRRINMGSPDSKDEFVRTAAVFDQMLSRIQASFEREQQFTNNASHELRTPVAVIMSRSEYALEHLDNREETEKSLQTILSQSRRMSTLISRLLFLARTDRGVIEPSSDMLDIGLIAEECIAMYQESARKKNITATVEAKEGIYIKGDEVLISQMLSNLISNAIKYGKPDGWVKVEVAESSKDVLIYVRDNGQGISSENLSQIWNRFYQADSSRKDGYGLGLPIARWIVQAHNGSIQVSSIEGKGTVFTVKLPAA